MNEVTKERTAYHEAGHAVIAFYLTSDLKVREVNIQQSGDVLGHTLLEDLPVDPDDSTPEALVYFEDYIIHSYAGELAERRFTGVPNLDGASKDYDDILKVITLRVGYDQKVIEAFDTYCLTTAEYLVGLRWKQIVAVAEELVEKEKIGNEELVRIIRKSR